MGCASIRRNALRLLRPTFSLISSGKHHLIPAFQPAGTGFAANPRRRQPMQRRQLRAR
jgi:hypothetical protein